MKLVPDQGLAGVHDGDLGPLHADGDGAVLVVDDWLVGVQVVDLTISVQYSNFRKLRQTCLCISNALKRYLLLLWMKLWDTKITVGMNSLAKGLCMPKYTIIMAKMPALLYPLPLVQERVEDVIRALCGVTGDSDTLKIHIQAQGLVDQTSSATRHSVHVDINLRPRLVHSPHRGVQILVTRVGSRKVWSIWPSKHTDLLNAVLKHGRLNITSAGVLDCVLQEVKHPVIT